MMGPSVCDSRRQGILLSALLPYGGEQRSFFSLLHPWDYTKLSEYKQMYYGLEPQSVCEVTPV